MASDQKTAQYSWVDYFYLVKAKWSLIVLMFSLSMMVGVGVRMKTPRIYEAGVRIAVDVPDESSTSRRASTHLQAASLDKMSKIEAGVMDRKLLLHAIDESDLITRWNTGGRIQALALLKENIRVVPDQEEEYFDIVAKDMSRGDAVSLANSIGLRFVDHREAEAKGAAKMLVSELTDEVNEILDTIEQIENRLYVLTRASTAGDASEEEAPELRRQLVSENYMLRSLEAKQQLAKVELREASSGLSVLQTAGEEDAVVADSGVEALCLHGFIGVMLGFVLVGLTSSNKSRAAVLKKLSDDLSVKLVGMAPIPSIPFAQMKRPTGRMIEAYRELRMRIHRLPAGDSMLVTMVPTAENVHLSEVVANLSTVIADAGQTLVVIDADFRKSRMHSLFDAAGSVGLTDFLTGEMRMEETIVKTRRPNLWMMPSGAVHDDPSGLLSSKRMDDLVWDLRSRFDYVVMVSPPIEKLADAGALIGYSDHTFLVSSYLGHSVAKLKGIMQSIESFGGATSGLILSQVFHLPQEVSRGTRKAGRSSSRRKGNPRVRKL